MRTRKSFWSAYIIAWRSGIRAHGVVILPNLRSATNRTCPRSSISCRLTCMPTFRRPPRLPTSLRAVRISSYRNPDKKVTVPRIVPRTAPSSRMPVSPLLHPPTERHAVSLTLPVPPSVNHQYATVNGRRLISSAGRAYKAQVGQLVWVKLAQSAHRAALLARLQSEWLALSIRFYFTSALRRDVDGGLKIAQDALCEGLGINDNRIVETHLYKHIDKDNPRIEVRLTPASSS
ncbi:MAG: RusA family crossover junction endodeoxyribonuclease [Nitrospirae bacterium]|nr:MAG: RusA family crossover junction endodeoxyribonuclease [Nitrospirota bacterium]